jgi:hypothetical protein
MKKALLLAFCVCASAKRGEFLNSTGTDGKFHLRPDMYLCLSFSFDTDVDVRDDAHLHGELLFNNMEGHIGLESNPSCTPVTQLMIDQQNKSLDAIAPLGPMKPGEHRSVTIK